jgi:hypothetical protein
MLPRAFDDLEVDPHQVKTTQAKVLQAIEQRNVSLAFSIWSQSAEETLRQASTIDGVLPGRRYLGRANKPVPVRRVLTAPRFKQGRATDFRVQFPAVALKGSSSPKTGPETAIPGTFDA